MFRIPFPLAPRWLRWLAVAGVASVIVFFSLLTTVPEPPTDQGPIWDKQLHVAAYTGLAYVLASATVERRSRQVL